MNREGIRHNVDEHAYAKDGRGVAEDRSESTTRVGDQKRKSRPFDWLADDPDDRPETKAGRRYRDMYGRANTPIDDALDELYERFNRDYEGGRGGRNRNDAGQTEPDAETLRGSAGNAGFRREKTAETRRGAVEDSAEEARILGSDNPYEVLGLSAGATQSEIRTRYKTLVRKYDPSRGIITKSTSQKIKEEKLMVKVHRAYGRLKAGGR